MRTKIKSPRHNPELKRIRQAAKELEEANEILVRTSERFQHLFQEVPIPTFSFDTNGKLIEWNRAFSTSQLFAAIPLEKAIWEVFGKAGSWDNSREMVSRVIAGELIDGAECNCVMPDGQIVSIVYSSFPIRNHDGDIVGGIFTYFDISEIKRNEIERANHNRQQIAIMEMGQLALSGASVERLLRQSCQEIRETLEVDLTLMLELINNGATSRLIAASGAPERVIGSTYPENYTNSNLIKEEPVSLAPVEQGKRHNFRNRRSDQSLSAVEPLIQGALAPNHPFEAGQLLDSMGIASAMRVAVDDGSKVYGFIGAYSKKSRTFTNQEERFMQSISNVISSALHRERVGKQIADYMAVLHEQKDQLESANMRLETLATVDGLTGLKNHRYFQEQMAQLFAESRRTLCPLSLILLDVDHFKSYNDEFGHPEGDVILHSVANLLQNQCRGEDVVARYGGEEFAIILPNLNERDALSVAERLRSTIEQSEWRLRPITASFGVATISAEMFDQSELIADADSALYASKHTGRNKVAVGRYNKIKAA